MAVTPIPARPAARPGPLVQPIAQLLYARLLDWGARLGLLALVAGFAVYVLGWRSPQVPLEQLPQLWNQPADIFLQRTGIAAGWGWLALAHKADVANLLGIALLAGCSLPPLLAVMVLYLKERDRVHAALCAGVVAVVLLAASGLLSAGH
jgi:hypothetical protein